MICLWCIACDREEGTEEGGGAESVGMKENLEKSDGLEEVFRELHELQSVKESVPLLEGKETWWRGGMTLVFPLVCKSECLLPG